jgi:hypothetical protein
MVRYKIRRPFLIFILGIFLLITGLLLVINTDHSYRMRIRAARMNLSFARRSIRLFAGQNGRFPDSLQEMNEYGKRFPDRIQWYFPARESIAGKPNFHEHSALDGTGGLYYNPQTGDLRLNLTKPLKSYWRFYFGEEKNEVPADW